MHKLRLTAKEVRVLELIMQGMLNPEIAMTMDISVRTVKKHKNALFNKFGISERYVKTVRLVHLVSRGR